MSRKPPPISEEDIVRLVMLVSERLEEYIEDRDLSFCMAIWTDDPDEPTTYAGNVDAEEIIRGIEGMLDNAKTQGFTEVSAEPEIKH